MPGLVDCHVHLCHDGVVDVVSESRDGPYLATVKAVANAERALLAGVTSVRDLGAKDHMVLGVAEAISRGVIGGPRIVAAGRLLTMTGGHGHFLGREVDGADAMRHAVREEIKAGATVIKTVATGGVLTPRVTAQQSAYSLPELEAAVETAHAAGVPITSHAIGNAGIKVALRAGVDCIEHGCFLDDEAVELMVAGGVALVATFSAPAGILRGREQGVPEHAVRKSEEVLEAHKASFRRAVDAGVRIACGTDAGTPLNVHGSTAGEVAFMVEYGLSPQAALVAATRTGAEVLRIDAVAGTLEAGKAADILVVDGDPLADIAALEQPYMVVARGQRIRP
jgi:imidazolonepropionase-like amidohydrolase